MKCLLNSKKGQKNRRKAVDRAAGVSDQQGGAQRDDIKDMSE